MNDVFANKPNYMHANLLYKILLEFLVNFKFMSRIFVDLFRVYMFWYFFMTNQ